ncbi:MULTISPECIES: hypothetical protein [Vibrio]|nr:MULTISPECIES: hypothetical protein [Vibrio]EEX34353.1 hypothetical protein VIC_001149 [Vibrio coralliilyticus ATCC BAA-450]MDE3898398.1 hypothetical protein [Vibrio sp. CC007]
MFLPNVFRAGTARSRFGVYTSARLLLYVVNAVIIHSFFAKHYRTRVG